MPMSKDFEERLFPKMREIMFEDDTLTVDKVRTGDLGGRAGTAEFTKALVGRISASQ